MRAWGFFCEEMFWMCSLSTSLEAFFRLQRVLTFFLLGQEMMFTASCSEGHWPFRVAVDWWGRIVIWSPRSPRMSGNEDKYVLFMNQCWGLRGGGADFVLYNGHGKTFREKMCMWPLFLNCWVTCHLTGDGFDIHCTNSMSTSVKREPPL